MIELVVLSAITVVALVTALVLARRAAMLRRAAAVHLEELAALERFTAALASCETAEAVGDVVRRHGADVVGGRPVVLVHRSSRRDAPDEPRQGSGVEVADGSAEPRHLSLLATMSEQAAQALWRTRRTGAAEHLAAVGAALARATTRDEVMTAIITGGAVLEDVWSVTSSLYDPSRRLVEMFHGEPDRPAAQRWTEVPDDVDAPQLVAIRSGEIVSAADPPAISARFPEWAEEAARAGVAAVVAVPLVIADRVPLGALEFTFATPRLLDQREMALVSTIARLAAEALSRARRFERERRVASSLQDSLQPSYLPDVPGWRLTATLLPGEEGVSVGGDWYDVATLRDGRVLLSVGDVTGRGPLAAGVMGIVRAAVRALAVTHDDPATILDHTDEVLGGFAADRLATAWIGLLDPATGRLRWSSAGHPPPLVIGPAGKRFLEDQQGLLLGTRMSGERHSSEHHVEHEASIVAYTDGLCERRDEPFTDSLKRMAVALGDGTGLDTATVLRRVITRPAADDVAVLVATRLPPDGR